MKVTKLKRGYRINLSDSEMSVLRTLFGEGSESGLVTDLIEHNGESDWTPAEKAIVRKLPIVGEHWLKTTEDRRGELCKRI